MVKSIAGVNERKGKTMTIGDNRYGMREAYDDDVAKNTREYYREGDSLTVKEVKNPLTQKIRTVKK